MGSCIRNPIAFGLPATVPIPVRSGPQGSVTILYCAWSFVTKKSSKTKRNAGLFLDFFSTPFGIQGVEKAWKSDKKSSPTSIKMEAWGDPGGSWGSTWRHLGAKSAQSSKNLKKVTSRTPPLGTSGEPKFEKNAVGRHFLSFFCRYFSSLDFSTILGDFRLRN